MTYRLSIQLCAAVLLFATTCAIPFTTQCAAQTPHYLLSNHDAESGRRALLLMEGDMSWVDRKDSSGRTPLHLAARFRHVEVVDWLLRNGADVNAQAYNNYTPLHVTHSPEVVKLILEQNPDLSLVAVSGTPLHDAITERRHHRRLSERAGRSSREADELQEIVELYVEHLGEDLDLTSAIMLGKLETVKAIMSRDPANDNNWNSPNPLRIAAEWGRLDICRYLIKEHDVDVDDFEGGTGYPIVKAALEYPEIVTLLIENGADLETRISWRGGRSGIWIIGDDATALHFAAAGNEPETLGILIDAGVDVFARDRHFIDDGRGQTALEVAAYFGRTDNAIAILERPEFKDAPDDIWQNVLNKSLLTGSFSSWLASEAQDRAELVDALITHGADVRYSENGNTAIQLAVSSIHPDNVEQNADIRRLVSVLKKHGAEMDVFSAVAAGDFESLAVLLDESPDSGSSRSSEGYPALHKAVDMKYTEAVKLLLAAGCDVDIANECEDTGRVGDTPLHSAVFWGHLEIAQVLLDGGADVNAKASDKYTPLHEAVAVRNVAMARLLLENGADMEARNEEGQTPLDLAGNSLDIRQLFSEFDDRR